MKHYKLAETKNDLLKRLDEHGRGLVKIGERKICLVQHNGNLHAFDHLCPHAKHSLLEGKINYQNEIICPLHGYRYSLKNGTEGEQRTNDLRIHQLESRDDGFFLGLNE